MDSRNSASVEDDDVIFCEEPVNFSSSLQPSDENIILIDADDDEDSDNDFSPGNDDDVEIFENDDIDTVTSIVDETITDSQLNPLRIVTGQSESLDKVQNEVDKTIQINVDKEASKISEEQQMLADFNDALAPDIVLEPTKTAADNDNGTNESNSNNDVIDDGENSFKTLKDKSSSTIMRISSLISRRLSADDDSMNVSIENQNDKNDDDSRSAEAASEINDDRATVEKRELRPRNRYSYNENEFDKSESGILIVQGFSLQNNDSEEADKARRLHYNAINENRSLASLDLSNRVESMPANVELVQVKQEPLSPSQNYPVPEVNIKKEMDDWTSMPSEPIDIKPDITLLEGFETPNLVGPGRRQRYHYQNGVPCEPCKAVYPNYFKFLRHTKSNKHKRNIAFYEANQRMAANNARLANEPHLMKKAGSNSIPTRRQIMSNFTLSPCPFRGCKAAFKHRRNLVTHVRTTHGVRLRDVQSSVPTHVLKTPEELRYKVSDTNNSFLPSDVLNSTEDASYHNVESTDNSSIVGSDQLTVNDDETNSSNVKAAPLKCSHCPLEFDYQQDLKAHLLMKHKITTIVAKLRCDRCHKNFHRKTGLLSHMRSCGMYSKSKKCPYCGMLFPSVREITQHKSRCPKRYQVSVTQPMKMVRYNVAPNEDGTYSCEECNISFDAQHLYANHMENDHPNDVSELNTAPTENKDGEEKVNQSGEPNTPLNDSSTAEQLDTADQDEDGKYTCRYCIRKFEDIDQLQGHFGYHDKYKIFQCKLCLLELNCKRYFQDHMRSHFITHRGQYLCWTCYKPFNNRRELGAHKSMHVKLKKFSCKICKKSFYSDLALERHNYTHNDMDESPVETNKINAEKEKEVVEEQEKHFICNVCKKHFSSEMSLEKHSKLHNPVKMELVKKFVHICSNCKFVFKTSSALNDHQPFCKGKNNSSTTSNEMTNSQELFRCDKCHSTFTKRFSLNSHKRMNRCPLFKMQTDFKLGNVRIYLCRYCKKGCQTIFGLYRHLKSCRIMKIKRQAAGVDMTHCIKCRKQFSSMGVLFNHEKFCNVKRIDEKQLNDINNQLPASTSITLIKKFECSNCKIDCNNDEGLKRHMKFCRVFNSNPKERNARGDNFIGACNICSKKFKTSLSYRLHKKYCTSDAQKTNASFKCQGCNKLFLSQDRLRFHEKSCNLLERSPVVLLPKPQDSLVCHCGRVFSNTTDLDSHKETCNVQNNTSTSENNAMIFSKPSGTPNMAVRSVLTCEYCFRTFSKYQAKNSHMRRCEVKLSAQKKGLLKKSISPKRRYSYGASSSSNSVTITPYNPNAQPSYGYNCVTCKGSFSTNEEFIDHSCHEVSLANDSEVNNITVEPDIPQEILDLQSYNSSPQKQVPQSPQNQYNKSPKKVFKCTPCNRIYSGSSALSKHMQLFHGKQSATSNVTVNSDGSFRCPKCPRSFQDPVSLTRHVGWHTRIKGLESSETTSSSNSSFPAADVTMTSPNEMQVQQQHFSCTICFKRFSGRGQLQNHIKAHNNNASANQPAQTFEANSSYTESMRYQKGPYRCKICPKFFKDRITLMKHHNLHNTVSPANSLQAKMLSRAGKTYVSCNICHKILSSNSITKHNKLHRMAQERPVMQPVTKFDRSVLPTSALLPCSYCNKLFRSQKSLNEHVTSAHGYAEQETAVTEKQPTQYQHFLQQPYEGDDDDDVVFTDEQPNDEEITYDESMDTNKDTEGTAQDHPYKCEICDKSWKHRSMYLRHVNAISHKELTKRLSDILTRVNHDANSS